MGRKKKEATATVPKQAAVLAKQPISTEARVTELEGDLLRLAELLGKTFGEPLKAEALAIVQKRQGV